ncbi:hypothetical protein [Amaricoccus sp.]|uniref:hypothetical protein n=1 Tax=Amaricoccus sp. TaxID=1872485 RepID=UPI001B553AA0|nr:hypothetical protein [Amaricoccus sp.]MBP7001710.1 hypothetical protein [Amaricoccus sp.]
MLHATEEETDQIVGYMEWQAPDLTVQFVQKIYSESVAGHQHDVWDVHTDKDRWWVITNPTNLYSQDQFPNMDLALTFHIGLCIRIPRSEKPTIAGQPVEPFVECLRYLKEASDALSQAEEVADYQAIGVRCREGLLAFTSMAQKVVPWTGDAPQPKQADFKAWVDHVCNSTLPGEHHAYRRQLFKNLLNGAWTFTNWLTHAKRSHWHDADAAVSTCENAVSLCMFALIQHFRGVPPECPACGSQRLSPERAFNPETGEEWERPNCTKCDWTGQPVRIEQSISEPEAAKAPPDSPCVLPTVPLRRLLKPGEGL